MLTRRRQRRQRLTLAQFHIEHVRRAARQHRELIERIGDLHLQRHETRARRVHLRRETFDIDIRRRAARAAVR